MARVRYEVSDYDKDLEELQHPSFYGKWCTREYSRCWEREVALRHCLWKIGDPDDLVYRHVMEAYDYAVSRLLYAYRVFEVRYWIDFSIQAKKDMEQAEKEGRVNYKQTLNKQ